MLCNLFSTFFALNLPPQNKHILLIFNNIFTLVAIVLYADIRFDERCKNQV